MREIEENALAEAGVTRYGVIERLVELISKCMDEETFVITDPLTGRKTTSTRKLDASGANKALELLGKQLGMFTDKTEMDVTGRMSEGDRRIMEKVAKRLGIGEDADN